MERYIDSCGDHYATAHIMSKWDSATGCSPTVQAGGRNGNCLQITGVSPSPGYGYLTKNISVNAASLIAGLAFNVLALPAATMPLFAFADTGNAQCTVGIDNAGRVNVWRGNYLGTLLGTSSPGLVQAGVWIYLEMSTLFATGATGTVTVNLGQVQVLTLPTVATSITTTTANQFSIWGINGSTTNFDDIYVLDGTGGVNNSFWGDTKVGVLFPSADTGTVQWTTSAGGVHYSLVNEADPDGDATYVSSATVGNVDLYDLQDLAGSISIVRGVQVCRFARKDDASARVVANALGGSGTVYGANQSLPQTYAYQLEQLDQDPRTSVPWTPTLVNSLQLGTKVIS